MTHTTLPNDESLWFDLLFQAQSQNKEQPFWEAVSQHPKQEDFLFERAFSFFENTSENRNTMRKADPQEVLLLAKMMTKTQSRFLRDPELVISAVLSTTDAKPSTRNVLGKAGRTFLGQVIKQKTKETFSNTVNELIACRKIYNQTVILENKNRQAFWTSITFEFLLNTVVAMLVLADANRTEIVAVQAQDRLQQFWKEQNLETKSRHAAAQIKFKRKSLSSKQKDHLMSVLMAFLGGPTRVFTTHDILKNINTLQKAGLFCGERCEDMIKRIENHHSAATLSKIALAEF